MKGCFLHASKKATGEMERVGAEYSYCSDQLLGKTISQMYYKSSLFPPQLYDWRGLLLRTAIGIEAGDQWLRGSGGWPAVP